MNRFILVFAKEGYIKYISHLDLMRLFKGAFKRSGIDLRYSQGYHPHPKMSFAQPLSLGYESDCEILEFETENSDDPEKLLEGLRENMPEAVALHDCIKIENSGKTLAARTYAAEYEIRFPLEGISEAALEKQLQSYLLQEHIIAQKREKKSKRMKDVDIRGKIRSIRIAYTEHEGPETIMAHGASADEGAGKGAHPVSGSEMRKHPETDMQICLEMLLDAGSDSNLSPELVIKSFFDHAGIKTHRSEVSVRRKNMLIKGFNA